MTLEYRSEWGDVVNSELGKWEEKNLRCGMGLNQENLLGQTKDVTYYFKWDGKS